MSRHAFASVSLVGFLAAVMFAGPAPAETGVTEGTILFGQSTALDGPASALGLGMRDGIAAAFKEINDAGGIKGRLLELKSYDDGYEPDRAIVATKTLIETDRVFALIGAVGTPTSKAAQPIATGAGVPFIGPYTGAEFLRDPGLRNVVNLRASYFQETETWVEHLTQDLGVTRLAILYQDDSFGRAGYDGVSRALAKRNMTLAAEGVSAQHHGREVGAARHPRRQPRGDRHGRSLQADCRIHQAGARPRHDPAHRQHLLCRGGGPRPRTRAGRRSRHRQPGRTVALGYLHTHRGAVSEGPEAHDPEAKPGLSRSKDIWSAA
jgi:hypothetical protein